MARRATSTPTINLSRTTPYTHTRSPETILVIGGGESGTIRKILTHEHAQSATLCEIDAEVIQVARKLLQAMESEFSGPCLRIFTGDGSSFQKNHEIKFDVNIGDT